MTLKDIAKEAGVSIMTVSNVINGKFSRVSDKTIDKVNKIIKKYEYVPNLTARSLAANSSHIVLVLIPYLSDYPVNLFYSPYVSEIVGLIELKLREKNYFTMIRSVNSLDEIKTIFKNWNYDGIVFILPTFDNMLSKVIEASNVPLVFLDSYSDHDSIVSVRCDDYRGIYKATEYLIAHGHKQIAFAGDYRNSILLNNRFNGYADALLAHNIIISSEYIFESPPDYPDGILIGKEIAENNKEITAIVTCSDLSAIGIMEGARNGGLKIPEDLSIIGYDNLDLCNYTTPKLTSINQQIAGKADKVIEVLLDLMDNKDIQNKKITLDVDVIERESVAQI